MKRIISLIVLLCVCDVHGIVRKRGQAYKSGKNNIEDISENVNRSCG